MTADLLARVASELALFAAVGFLLFSADDLLVDLLYFARKLTDGRDRLHLAGLAEPEEPGWMVVTIPAWEEANVIAPMLRATLERLDHANFTLLVGHYRNDPATALAIHSVDDPRVVAVEVPANGPTTKADCLNHLYAALIRLEAERGRSARAIVLHDAEDLVHPQELRVFDALIERAGLVQLPVVPLTDPASSWVAGHYCDEFAESHGKDLVVREAVGAAVPLAGVGCAIARPTRAALAAENDGKPFAGGSMTEDYEMGLRVGALGGRTLFARLADPGGRPGVIASRGHFPATLGAAVRQKARWVGGIAFSGWDRLGWRGGWGERWFRMRDRKGPLAAVLLLAGYLAAIIWGQLALAASLGAPPPPPPSPTLLLLLKVNTVLLIWRLLMRAIFTTRAYGLAEGMVSLPRVIVGNLIAILASWRAFSLHLGGGPKQWDKTAHVFPAQAGAK